MSQEYEPLLKLINIHMFSARHSCRASNALTFPALLCIDYPSRYRSPFRDICVIILISDRSYFVWLSSTKVVLGFPPVTFFSFFTYFAVSPFCPFLFAVRSYLLGVLFSLSQCDFVCFCKFVGEFLSVCSVSCVTLRM